MQVDAPREREAEREERERARHESDRDRGPETSLLRRGGDHLGRRRLAGGERGGERVAARESGRDVQRGRGTLLRVCREAALDDALDERV